MTVTSYVYPAITDNKIIPTSFISKKYESNTISIKGSYGEYVSASFIRKCQKTLHFNARDEWILNWYLTKV